MHKPSSKTDEKQNFFDTDSGIYERAYQILAHQRNKLDTISIELNKLFQSKPSKTVSKLQNIASALIN